MVDKTVLPTSVLAPQICRARSAGHSSPPTGVVGTPMDTEAEAGDVRVCTSRGGSAASKASTQCEKENADLKLLYLPR